MKFFAEADVRRLLHWKPLIDAMETALSKFSAGKVIQPVRNMITIEEGKRYLGIMPAVAEKAMGLKLVSFYPGNAGTVVPTHLGLIILARPDTGEPLAVMDGRLITEFHTLGFRQTHWGWMRGNLEYMAVFVPPSAPPPPDRIQPCSP